MHISYEHKHIRDEKLNNVHLIMSKHDNEKYIFSIHIQFPYEMIHFHFFFFLSFISSVSYHNIYVYLFSLSKEFSKFARIL